MSKGEKGGCVGAGTAAIDVNTAAGAAVEEAGLSLKRWAVSVWEFAREDGRRVTFSLKVGVAVLLVSLLVLARAPYDVLGTSIVWSIFTVGIVFEYSVGATLNRGINGATGSMLAGILVVAVARVTTSSGRVAGPCLIGLSIFLIGALTSFMKLWPPLLPYEDCFRVTLFTYSLIIVSSYRVGSPLRNVTVSLYSIAIGGFVAVAVNLLFCPVWDGDHLHRELVDGFLSVADALEECVRKYLTTAAGDGGSDEPAADFVKTVMDDFPDEPAFARCRAALNSSAVLEALANSAKWEPPHGRFRHFFYPWSEYVKVGAVLRHCAYEVMALHGCLHSEIQAPHSTRMAFQREILDAAGQAAELLRSLGTDIGSMRRTAQTSLLRRVRGAGDRLQRAIDFHSLLLTPAGHRPHAAESPPATAVFFHAGGASPEEVGGGGGGLGRAEPYRDAMRRSRRLCSWPCSDVDDCEAGGGRAIPRMRALESTAALSLATFASLLIEFVARLDHLVDSVDELGKIARFDEKTPNVTY